MTDKLYLITEAQHDLLHKVIANAACSHFITDRPLIIEADKMLQSLPMVDREPVAWMNPNSPYSVMTTNQKEHNEFQYSDEFLAGHTQPLYTSPQALTPITAADITDEMVEYIATHLRVKREIMALSINSWIKHRSEAK